MRVIDHQKTQTALESIMGNVREIGKAYEHYEANKDLGEDQAMYSAEYVKEHGNKALAQLVMAAESKRESFENAIKTARDNEKANDECCIDLTDARLSNAFMIIEKFGDDAVKVIEDVISNFRGEKVYLDSVKVFMEKDGKTIPDHVAKYFYEGRFLFDNLDNYLSRLTVEPKDLSAFANVTREIKEIVDILNLEPINLDDGLAENRALENALTGALGL